MEYCLGVRNFAAMAVSSCATWRTRRKTVSSADYRYSLFKVKGSGGSSNTRSDSCVAVKQDFADEEDYIKAGGTQLVFVEMQQNQSMDKQSKLVDNEKKHHHQGNYGNMRWEVPEFLSKQLMGWRLRFRFSNCCPDYISRSFACSAFSPFPPQLKYLQSFLLLSYESNPPECSVVPRTRTSRS